MPIISITMTVELHVGVSEEEAAQRPHVDLVQEAVRNFVDETSDLDAGMIVGCELVKSGVVTEEDDLVEEVNCPVCGGGPRSGQLCECRR